MAIGIALLFNIKLPINFNSPYKARNIQDFWRRWHITLSRFLRDYVYIPLGGNKISSFRTYSNLLATFVIGGLWHGAGWTFIFWGFLHGMALVIHRAWSNLGFKMWTWLAWLITFNFVNIAWVFFRAKEWDDAVRVLGAMFSLDNVVIALSLENISGDLFTILWIIAGFILVLFFKNTVEKAKELKINYKTLFFTLFCLLAALLSVNKVSEFLYFNF